MTADTNKSTGLDVKSDGHPADEKLLQAMRVHPAFYITFWISMSSSVILFNKYILHTAGFPYPIFLTTWHLTFATIATRVLAVTTTLLDGRHKVKMDMATYGRAIVPIGVFFSLSLITCNQAYLYLSVAFIQMLKAATPVAVLFATSALTAKPIDMKVLLNVSVIVVGVMIASYGEIEFVLVGVLFQVAGIACEAIRLVLVQILLSSKDYNMDPLCSIYYFAPICAGMNFVACLFFESEALSVEALSRVGFTMLFANASVAFMLNIAVVFLIGKTSSLVLCLSGVLKDIILVVLSIIIWGTTVTGTQFFGYSIALAGLVVYKGGVPSIEVMTSALERSTGIRLSRKQFIVIACLAFLLTTPVFIFVTSGFQAGGGHGLIGGSVGMVADDAGMVESSGGAPERSSMHVAGGGDAHGMAGGHLLQPGMPLMHAPMNVD